MRLDKFTLRGQEAIQAGIELAERNQNQQVEPEHILCAMLDQPESIVRPLLGKLGANVQVIKNDCEAAVARFPRVQGGQQYFSPRLSQIFTAAQKRAEKMQDEFISTEHLLLAITEEKDRAGKSDSSRFLVAGAKHAFWVRTAQGKLEKAMPGIRRRLDEAENARVIVEAVPDVTALAVGRYDEQRHAQSARGSIHVRARP